MPKIVLAYFFLLEWKFCFYILKYVNCWVDLAPKNVWKIKKLQKKSYIKRWSEILYHYNSTIYHFHSTSSMNVYIKFVHNFFPVVRSPNFLAGAQKKGDLKSQSSKWGSGSATLFFSPRIKSYIKAYSD